MLSLFQYEVKRIFFMHQVWADAHNYVSTVLSKKRY